MDLSMNTMDMKALGRYQLQLQRSGGNERWYIVQLQTAFSYIFSTLDKYIVAIIRNSQLQHKLTPTQERQPLGRIRIFTGSADP